jgi:hypothetical protein
MEKNLISSRLGDVEKTRKLLQASVDKYVPYDIDYIYTADELEYYDSLSYRFEKCVELALNFFKTLELFLYAKQSDTLRDRLLMMQKIKIVEDIDSWMDARLLRNKITHAYLPEEIRDIYDEIFTSSKKIFAAIERIKKYLADRKEKILPGTFFLSSDQSS